MLVDEAWLICYNYNNVLNLRDRLVSNVTLDEVQEFKQCLRECDAQEMITTDPFFTWLNKQEGVDWVFFYENR